MLLGDTRNEQNPTDDFKKTFFSQKQNTKQITGKALTCDFTAGQNPNRQMKTIKGKKRWSEREGIAREGIKFEGDDYESIKLREPMWSSFRKDNVFVEAPLGKGLNSFEKKGKR
jgi:hypothetical protein